MIIDGTGYGESILDADSMRQIQTEIRLFAREFETGYDDSRIDGIGM